MIPLLAFVLLIYIGTAAAIGTFAKDDPALQHISYGDDALKSRSPMQLHVMSDKGLKGMGAVCLDGSDAAFYFSPASDPKNANDWQIHFQGGGWCYDETDCWGRSSVPGLGTTTGLQPIMNQGGIMGDDCTKNPDFCNFNRVHMVYCDGNSFSGNRDEPVIVTGLDGKQKPLYFRGKRIIDATLQTLLTLGLDRADNVLLTGCSAGGLATFLHTDYVHNWLISAKVTMTKFRSAPISGFFLLHDTVESKPVYPEEMKYIFQLANSSHGLNEHCIAAQSDEEKWKCNFAEHSYTYIQAPIFPFNSALDSWQTGCIYTAEFVPGFPMQNVTSNGICSAAPGWKACATNPEKCDAAQMATMNRYLSDFQTVMRGKGTYRKHGNGAFVHSCHTHCEALGDAWNTIAVNGVTIQQAFSKWWHSKPEPASSHTYASCLYHEDRWPHQCNPTCGATAQPSFVV
eukprot:gnl/TRDRNA2_/TRDRNA2_91395_c0_seq1.p1 gnl/TRDRNA2_/TRDRNA2_91395_c0~~gnl/TRDRNA2_/TRDRNA2_91395_c0_seq1.p1  ORF type:complete len:456 (+),score=34.85 gnl/TRDRNA2_/TRDRNA2_91395_c0_seq1:61-1428(+)